VLLQPKPTGVLIMPTLREKMKREMTLRGLASSTQTKYLKAVIKLQNHFKRSPAQLSTEDIKSFLFSISSHSPISASTYNIIIHGLKFFYEIVLDKKMVAINLPRKKEPQKLPDILSQAEVQRIIQATDNLKHKTILTLIYGAGLRASEAASLRVKDIDNTRSVIHIRQGKGNKDRYVLLSPLMLNMLRCYWKECRLKHPIKKSENDFIFLGPSGTSFSAVSIAAMYRRAKQSAGITKQGGVHALRHAFAIHALESNADLYTIKQLLGHASINSTVRYLRMTDKKLHMFKPPIEQLNL
jgi:integrase/recombinase XerD